MQFVILFSVLQLSAANIDCTGVDDEDLTIAPQTVMTVLID
jgi:hypothetical protein